MAETPSNEPIKIDLNNLDSDSIESLGLNQKQKDALKEYIKTKEAKEKRWIIELTQKELVNLKIALESEWVKDEFDFIEQQLSEITTTSELFMNPESKEWNKTEAEKFVDWIKMDKLTYDLLFWTWWKLESNKSFSEVTKRNLSTWLSLFILENLNTFFANNKDWKNKLLKITDIINKWDFKKLIKWEETWALFSELLDSASWKKIQALNDVNFDEFPPLTEEIKNPMYWKELFNTLATWWDISEINLDINTINPDDKKKVLELWNALWKNIPWMSLINSLLEQKEKLWDSLEVALWKNLSPSLLESIKWFSEKEWFISKIFQFFLDLFWIDLTKAIEKSSTKKIKETLISLDSEKGYIINKKNLNDDFFTNLDSDKWKAMTKLKEIANLEWKKCYDKDFLLWLLKKDSEFSKSIAEWNELIKNSDKSVDYDVFTSSLEKYLKILKEKKTKPKEVK